MTSFRLSILSAAACMCATVFASLPIDGFEFVVLRENPPRMRICGVENGTVFKGDLIIPDSVVRPGDGRKYAVVEIGAAGGNVRDTVFADKPAFYNQPLITSVSIPATVTEIWEDSFRGCSGIREWKVAAGNPEYISWDGVLYTKSSRSGKPDALLRFPAASPMTEWAIPPADSKSGMDYRYVERGAFRDNSNLKTLTIDSSVWLYDYSFEGNQGITEFKGSGGRHGALKDGMILSADGKTLYHVPAGRTGLLNIPVTVTEISPYAFSGSHCNTIKFNNVTEIGDHVFAGAHFRKMVIPVSVTQIDYALFEECKELEEVVIETKITDVPSFMFRDCSALRSVTLPTSCKGLRNQCFSGCRSLTVFSLANYTRLGKGAPYVDEKHFAMSGLTKMNWPSKVEDVPDKMFFGCRDFKSVSLKETTKTIGEYAFWGTGLESFNTLNLEWIKDYALDGCVDLKRIVIAETDHTLMVGPGCFQLNPDTEVYLDHKDLYFKGWNTSPEVQDNWPTGAFKGEMNETVVYTSLVNPANFLPRWKELYCPALTVDFYTGLYNKGNVSEMFRLVKNEGGYSAIPGYDWVAVSEVKEASDGLHVSYLANGEKLHSVYPLEMLVNLPTGVEMPCDSCEMKWSVEANRFISDVDGLEILYLCSIDGHNIYSGYLSAKQYIDLPGAGVYILKSRLGSQIHEAKILVR